MHRTHSLKLLLIFFLLAFNVQVVFGATMMLDLKVSASGEVDISGSILGVSNTHSKAKMLLLPIPFGLKSNAVFETAQDVKLVVVSKGNSYTLLALIAEVTGEPISFGIKGGISQVETSEGKRKIEIFPDYKFLTKAEKALVFENRDIDFQSVEIHLPKKYNSTEVAFRPLTINVLDNQSFAFSNMPIPIIEDQEYWIVFPNPATEDLKWAQIIVSLLLGIFTIAFHIPALRRGNLTWQVFVLTLSSIILIVSIYFTINLSKKLDFGLFIAAASPHVLFGLVATLWLLVSERYRAVVTGSVLKGNVSVKFATVILEQKIKNKFVEIKSTPQLDDNGRFSFSVLLFSGENAKYRVIAQMAGTQDVVTSEFSLSRKQKHEEVLTLVPISGGV